VVSWGVRSCGEKRWRVFNVRVRKVRLASSSVEKAACSLLHGGEGEPGGLGERGCCEREAILDAGAHAKLIDSANRATSDARNYIFPDPVAATHYAITYNNRHSTDRILVLYPAGRATCIPYL